MDRIKFSRILKNQRTIAVAPLQTFKLFGFWQMKFSQNPYYGGKWPTFTVGFLWLPKEGLIHIPRVDASDVATTLLLPQSSKQLRLPCDNVILVL